MKVVFVTNFMSHHQLGVAEILYGYFGDGNFFFVEQEELTTERKNLGYKDSDAPYIVKDYGEEHLETKRLCAQADVIIITYSQGIKTIKEAMKKKTIVFWYVERLYKDYKLSWTAAKFIRARHFLLTGHNYNQYFLCASAYGEVDLRKTVGRYSKNKCLKYGYYPAFVLDPLESREKKEVPSFLYLGRFMELKHPEYLIYAAKEFKDKGLKANFNLVGKGTTEDSLKELVKELGVEDMVAFYPPCKASEVKNVYYNNDFFCFTSDRRDGYGSTLAEAMSCGCVSIASIEPGATNLFCKDGLNCFTFKGKDDFISKCFEAYNRFNEGKLEDIRQAGLDTIRKNWNYQVAGERLCKVIEAAYKDGNVDLYEDGPLALMGRK